MKQLAESNFHKAHYAADRISSLDGYELLFPDQEFFNELECRQGIAARVVNLQHQPSLLS